MSRAGGARPGALGRSPSGAAGRPGPRAQPGASAAAVLSALQDAPRCGSLSRPLSGPRPAPSAAGFPLTRTWGLQQPRVGARGRRTGGAGLGRGRRKGETAALMASGSEEGHLSSRPLSRAPLPRPCTGPGRGWALGVTWEGRACRTWTWTPPGPLQNSRPHSRRPVAWPGQSLTRGIWGGPRVNLRASSRKALQNDS